MRVVIVSPRYLGLKAPIPIIPAADSWFHLALGSRVTVDNRLNTRAPPEYENSTETVTSCWLGWNQDGGAAKKQTLVGTDAVWSTVEEHFLERDWDPNSKRRVTEKPAATAVAPSGS